MLSTRIFSFYFVLAIPGGHHGKDRQAKMLTRFGHLTFETTLLFAKEIRLDTVPCRYTRKFLLVLWGSVKKILQGFLVFTLVSFLEGPWLSNLGLHCLGHLPQSR
jgi:hypothetical protein